MKTNSITKEKLEEGMVVVHHHKTCKSITFNKILSSQLKKMQYEYVIIGSCNGKHYFAFYKEDPNQQCSGKISFIRSGGTGCSAVVYSGVLVKRLFELFKIKDFDCSYYFDIAKDFEIVAYHDHSIEIKKARKRNDYLLSNFHKESLTTTIKEIEEEPKISEATDEQLVKEMIKRGFTGELNKHFKLIQILAF